MNLADFLPYVLPEAPGCSDMAAERAIRLALIELCAESFLWSETQGAVNSVASQADYAYAPAAGQQIVRLEGLTINGVEATTVTPGLGRAIAAFGDGSTVAHGRPGGFTLAPAPVESGLPIVTTCAVAPSLDAATVPDHFGMLAEQIGRGALSRLLAASGKAYTDQRRAQDLSELWRNDIARARYTRATGGADVPLRTAPHYF